MEISKHTGVAGPGILEFRMKGTGNLPKGKEFTLPHYLLHEGHIHFLGEPSIACRKNSVLEKELCS